jgi:hypothetical protein
MRGDGASPRCGCRYPAMRTHPTPTIRRITKAYAMLSVAQHIPIEGLFICEKYSSACCRLALECGRLINNRESIITR